MPGSIVDTCTTVTKSLPHRAYFPIEEERKLTNVQIRMSGDNKCYKEK